MSLLAALALPGAGALAADAPNWTLESASGEVVDFAVARRQGPSIVLFWATWCPYCKALMPHLQSMLEEYDGERGLRIYAISYREDGDPVAYLQRQGYSFVAFPQDTVDAAAAYHVSGTPGLFVVDESGLIVLNLYAVTASMGNDPDWAELSNAEKAARRAPYWAARIREALDALY